MDENCYRTDNQNIVMSTTESNNSSSNKRTRIDNNYSYNLENTGEELLHFLDQFPVQDTTVVVESSTSAVAPTPDSPIMMSQQKRIESALEQLEQNVTCIKSSLEKKKPKITLYELNEKIETILEILQSWST